MLFQTLDGEATGEWKKGFSLQLQDVNGNEREGVDRKQADTQLLVLTASKFGGVVKVGEERVKLIGTEERVAAGLHAAGGSYAGDGGSSGFGKRKGGKASGDVGTLGLAL